MAAVAENPVPVTVIVLAGLPTCSLTSPPPGGRRPDNGERARGLTPLAVTVTPEPVAADGTVVTIRSPPTITVAVAPPSVTDGDEPSPSRRS